MNKDEIRALTRKIYLIGAFLPIIGFHIVMTMVLVFLFRFDSHMMLIYLYAVLIALVVLVPPVMAAMIIRTRKIMRILAQVGGDDVQISGLSPEQCMKLIDGYPIYMALLTLMAATMGMIIETLFIHFVGDYNGLLTIILFLMVIDGAIGTAYYEFFIQFRFFEPVRRIANIHFSRPGYKGGIEPYEPRHRLTRTPYPYRIGHWLGNSRLQLGIHNPERFAPEGA